MNTDWLTDLIVDFNKFTPEIRRVVKEALLKKIKEELHIDHPLLFAKLAAGESKRLFQEAKYEPSLLAAEVALQDLEGETSHDARLLRVDLLNNLAESQRNLGNREEALKNYDLAWQELQHTNRDRLKSTVLSNRGILLLGFGRIAEAIASQKLALQFDERADDTVGQGFSHHNLGSALAEDEQYSEALSHLELAVSIRESLNDFDELTASYSRLAEILHKLGRTKEGLVYIEKALALKPKLRNRFAIRQVLISRAALLESEQPSTEYLGVLDDLLLEVERLRETVKDFDRLEQFDERYNRHYEKAIHAHLRARQYSTAVELIHRTRSRSFKERYLYSVSGEIPSSSSIQGALASNEVLLEFWIYPTESYAFLHAPDEEEPRVVFTGHLQGNFLNGIRELLAAGPLTNQDGRRFNDEFVKPLSAYLGKRTRIYLVPHGAQFYVPFPALRYGEKPTYMCEENEIVILPSAELLPIFRQRPHVRSRSVCVVGDPDGSLPHARREALEIAKMLDAEPLIGDDATKERVLQRLHRREFDIIHFACHGRSLDSSGFGLEMAQGEVVTSHDISQLELRANLVSTASCWSGLVSFSAWNAFTGLSQAFLCAGANCIVSSIGPLSDEGSLHIFRRLYQGYRDRAESISFALAEAQRALLKVPALLEPKHWCPLYVTGKVDTHG